MPRWAEILLWLWLLSLVPVNDYQLWSITAYILFKGEGQFWVRPYEARAGEQSESPFWKCLFYTWKNFFFSSVLLDPCTSTNHLSILHIFHQIFSICFITIAKLIFFFPVLPGVLKWFKFLFFKGVFGDRGLSDLKHELTLQQLQFVSPSLLCFCIILLAMSQDQKAAQ